MRHTTLSKYHFPSTTARQAFHLPHEIRNMWVPVHFNSLVCCFHPFSLGFQMCLRNSCCQSPSLPVHLSFTCANYSFDTSGSALTLFNIVQITEHNISAHQPFMGSDCWRPPTTIFQKYLFFSKNLGVKLRTYGNIARESPIIFFSTFNDGVLPFLIEAYYVIRFYLYISFKNWKCSRNMIHFSGIILYDGIKSLHISW